MRIWSIKTSTSTALDKCLVKVKITKIWYCSCMGTLKLHQLHLSFNEMHGSESCAWKFFIILLLTYYCLCHQWRNCRPSTLEQSTCWCSVCFITHNISPKTENSFISAIIPRHYFITASPCQSYGLPVSVPHILVQCVGLRDIRTKYFTVSSVAELFQSVDNSIIINFIIEAHFYHQL